MSNPLLMLVTVAALLAIGYLFSQLDHTRAAGFFTGLYGPFDERGDLQLKERLDKRANIWDQMKGLIAETDGRSMTGEEIKRYETLESELTTLTQDIDARERHARASEALDRVETDPIVNPGTERNGDQTRAEYRKAFDGFIRNGMGGIEPEQRSVLRQGHVDDSEFRAAGIATGGAGGFTVPEEFRRKITEVMKWYGTLEGIASILETGTGAPIPWPSNDDTANEGAILGENIQITEQDIVFTSKTLGEYTYTSKLVRVSWQLLQDSAFDVEGLLARKFGERLGRIHNRHFTVGTGTAQPLGVQVAAGVGKVGAAGQTTTVTYDDLVDLEHAVDPAYRATGRARFMWHDLTLARIRKIKDLDGRPLWEPSIREGAPDTFGGRPYAINNHMPEMAASVKSILFGDFEAGYVIRRVRSMQIVRLEERYADFLQTGFFAFDRMDGTSDDPNAIKAYQNAAA